MMGSENYDDYGETFTDGLDRNRGFVSGSARTSKLDTPEPSSSTSSSYSPSRFFEHRVSNLDTLAGVAIKYGVEVADIRRMNGLVTDRQMFALKTLRIPLPGRHPPSPSLSNGCNTPGHSVPSKTPPRRILPGILNSFETLKTTPEQKVSPAMSSLQGYYGLREPRARRTQSEGCEMELCDKESACSVENGSVVKLSPAMKPPLSIHGKSRSLANVNIVDDMGNHMPLGESNDTDTDKWSGKSLRRRQKSEDDFTSHTPEKIIKEEGGLGGWFSAIAGKGLALRTKAPSRNNLALEATHTTEGGVLGVRKSSSTPTLHDQDNSNSSTSIWSGSWNLKPDLQALSNSAIAKPILDGWAKPITGGKSKTALD